MRLTGEERRLIDLIETAEWRARRLAYTRRLRTMNAWLDQREALLAELYRVRPWRRDQGEVAA